MICAHRMVAYTNTHLSRLIFYVHLSKFCKTVYCVCLKIMTYYLFNFSFVLIRHACIMIIPSELKYLCTVFW